MNPNSARPSVHTDNDQRRRQPARASGLLFALVAAVMSGIAAQSHAAIWLGGAGSWDDPMAWDTGVVPDLVTEDVLIDNGNANPSSVTLFSTALTNNRNIRDLTLDNGELLDLRANRRITINGNSVTNNGSITLGTTGGDANLILAGSNVIFSGSGTVTLGDNLGNAIYGTFLTNNATHTIEGRGELGRNADRLELDNKGLIVANVNGGTLGIALDPGATATRVNTGTILATNGGQVVFNTAGVLNNTGGVIEAQDGSGVRLDGTTIEGGTLRSQGTGSIDLQNITVTRSGLKDLTIDNNAQVRILPNKNSFLQGTINNLGDIEVGTAAVASTLLLNGNVRLEGDGTLTLTDNLANNVNGFANTDELTNTANHTIQGSGRLGGAAAGLQIGLNNEGLIVANQSEALIINLTDTAGVTRDNNGTMRADGGELRFEGTELANNSVVEARNNSMVRLVDSTIEGGILHTDTGGTIEMSNLSRLRDLEIDTGSQVIARSGQTSLVQGTITNNGDILVDSTGGGATLRIDGDATLTGNGTVTLSNTTGNQIDAVSNVNVLTNDAGHTIQGSGLVGSAVGMGLDNLGVIVANNAANPLTIQLLGQGTNSGTLQADNGGQLIIQGAPVSATIIDNTGGVIEALTGSSVVVRSNTTIIGGTLDTQGSGQIEMVTANALSTLQDLTNQGSLAVVNGQSGQLRGNIFNDGDIRIDSTGNTTSLFIDGDVTLAGSGTLTMSDSNRNVLRGSNINQGDVLTQKAGHTIQGSGELGDNQMGLDNEGLIVANNAANALVINLAGNSAGGGVVTTRTNTGVIRADGGQLTIEGSALDNSGGTIEALDGSNALLTTSSITGGILHTAGSGRINLQGAARLRDLEVDNGSQVALLNGQSAFLEGTITNNGRIQIESMGTNTDLRIAGEVTLTGGGTLAMADSSTSRVRSATAGTDRLINDAGHTIAGSGNLGTNAVEIENRGLILANQSANLVVNPSGSGVMLNAGKLRADAGSIMIVTDRFKNSGIIQANGGRVETPLGFDAGSGTVLIDGNGVVSIGANSSTADLTHNGSNPNGLSLGGNDLIVENDYTNVNFNTGDGFDLRANVSGTGAILAGGDVVQAISGANISGGTTQAPVLTIGNVHVGSNTFTYEVANAGTTGPTLRGALQTGVNGGNITDARLSGSGVTESASNFAVGAGGAGAAFDVVFDVANAGVLAPLSGQAVNIANNFDNVGDQLLSIETGSGAAAYRLANPIVNNSVSFAFGNVHMGDSVSQAVSITNDVAPDGFSEALDARFGGASDARIQNNAGTITQLGAGSTDNSSMVVSINTSAAGAVNGTQTLLFDSNGAGSSELGVTSLPSQELAVSATITGGVFRLANPEINNMQPLVFGNFREGELVTAQALSITNNVPDDGFSEALNAQANGTTGGVTTNGGSFALLGPTATDNTSITVAIDTTTAGDKSGVATIDFESDGTGSSGLGTTMLASQDVAVSGAVYRLADLDVAPSAIELSARVGDSVSQALSIGNAAIPDGFSEQLAITAVNAVGDVSTAGVVAGLINAGATDTNVSVELDTLSSGIKNGEVTVKGASHGTNTSGLTNDIALADAIVSVTGRVWQEASASVGPDPIDFGIVHVGDVVTDRNLSVTNTASGALVDVLRGGIGSVGGPFTASGNLGAGVAAGATDSTSLMVGLNTATAGVYSGAVGVDLVSHNNDLSDKVLTTEFVSLTGQVNEFANPIYDFISGNGTLTGADTRYVLDFGSTALGSGVLWMAELGITNSVTAPADSVDGVFGLGGVNDFMTSFADFFNLSAGDSIGGLLLNLDTATLGVGLYTDTIVLNAEGFNASGFRDSLAPIFLEIRGRVVGAGGSVPVPASLLLVLLGVPLIRGAWRRRV